jgi:hypothetical protein
MKPKRGRPQSLLARMKGKERAEIRNAIKYGTPAWRIIRLRETIGDVRGLLDNYLSAQLAHCNARMAAHVRERRMIYRKHRTHDARCRALGKMRHKPPIALLPLAVLWRELLAQIECALLRRDDDLLNELAKAFRGEVSPESRAQFNARVLDCFEHAMWMRVPPDIDLRVTSLEEITDVTASDIFKRLKKEQLPDGKLRVEGHLFENRDRVMEAIHDVAEKIGFVLARINKPQRPGTAQSCER